jgi:hypothetical protein
MLLVAKQTDWPVDPPFLKLVGPATEKVQAQVLHEMIPEKSLSFHLKKLPVIYECAGLIQ